MEREQITDERDKLTLRLNGELNCYIKKKADAMGVAQNAFLVMLIDLGLRYYEGEISLICPYRQQSNHD